MLTRSPRCRLSAVLSSITAACMVASGLITYDATRNTATSLVATTPAPTPALRTAEPPGVVKPHAYPDPTGYGHIGDLATAEVIVVGDSIANGCRNHIQAALTAGGVTSAVAYWSGRPTANGVNWALSLSRKPPVLVMELGSNDWADPSVMPAEIQRLYDGVPQTSEVLWIDTFNNNKLLATGWINQGIWGSRVYDVQVIPWYSWFAKKPTRITAYLRDGVHPNDTTGCAFFADVIKGPIVAAAS